VRNVIDEDVEVEMCNVGAVWQNTVKMTRNFSLNDGKNAVKMTVSCSDQKMTVSIFLRTLKPCHNDRIFNQLKM
jgi:hypothetical protein